MQLDVALDPKTLGDARDIVRSALMQDDPTSGLRGAAVELADRGFRKQGIEAVFVSVYKELDEAGRDEDAALVSYVLDMIADW